MSAARRSGAWPCGWASSTQLRSGRSRQATLTTTMRLCAALELPLEQPGSARSAIGGAASRWGIQP
eukprot:120230-Alexandrium_andersonii.AAC.1